MGVQIGVIAQDGFLQIRAVDVFEDCVPETAKCSAPAEVDDVGVIELFHDFAAPVELPGPAPVEAKLGQQHAEDELFPLLVRDQINVGHPALIDFLEDVEVRERCSDHVGATVANRPALCKRNPCGPDAEA